MYILPCADYSHILLEDVGSENCVDLNFKCDSLTWWVAGNRLRLQLLGSSVKGLEGAWN